MVQQLDIQLRGRNIDVIHPLIQVGTTSGLLASLFGSSTRAGNLLLPAEALVAA